MDWFLHWIRDIWMAIRRHLLICDVRSILIRDCPDMTDADIMTQKMRIDSHDVYMYMYHVKSTLDFRNNATLDMLDDVNWIPVKVTSVIGEFGPSIDSIMDYDCEFIKSRKAKERNIIWLPEPLVQTLRETGRVTFCNYLTAMVPSETTIFYVKEKDNE